MYLIRQLAKKYGLTRTTLLHYDKIDLLKPSTYSETGYRLYTDKDEKRLEKIVLFRSMGISLGRIKELIGSQQSQLGNALMKRLDELNREIGTLREQQKKIIELLNEVKVLEKHLEGGDTNIEQFPLLNDIDPVKWHSQFEAMSPEMHRKFIKVFENIPEKLKFSLRNAINGLPDSEREKLMSIIHKNNPAGH